MQPLRRRWMALSGRQQHWLINIAIGVMIELVVHLLAHTWHWAPLVVAQNGALDGMMRASAAAYTGAVTTPDMLLVEIDDAVWRSPRWGGGEPHRAPRDQLARLIERALAGGARQVVLDILIEGTPQGEALEEDLRFASALEGLLATGKLGAGQQLVLVRTLRPPYPLARLTMGAAAAGSRHAEGYLPELRESPALDAVVARSGGRIVVAAPYFRYSTDHVVRDWQLLQVVCQRRTGADGVLRTVPSVQLAVAAHALGVAAPQLPWHSDAEPPAPCRPFPTTPPVDAGALDALERQATSPAQLDRIVDTELQRSWERLREAFQARSLALPQHALAHDALGNRVVFRFARPPAVVGALGLLDGERQVDVDGRVVVIGQTYTEVPDMHRTPLGTMPGVVVLMNAIDSMTRHQVVEPPPWYATWGLALALIVGAGYAFARLDSFVASWVATLVVIALLYPLSYFTFKHGVWLDFALPLIGIQMHRTADVWKERIGAWYNKLKALFVRADRRPRP